MNLSRLVEYTVDQILTTSSGLGGKSRVLDARCGNIALPRLVSEGVHEQRHRDRKRYLRPPIGGTPHSCPSDADLGSTTYTLDSTMDSLDVLEHAAVDVARKAGFHGDALEKIGLAVHEIAANAVIHGNQFDSRKKVVATIARTWEQITITVSDGGAGFELEGLRDPLSPQALLKDSGRGIYLARAFMDEIHVQTQAAGGTTVTLIKYIRSSKLA